MYGPFPWKEKFTLLVKIHLAVENIGMCRMCGPFPWKEKFILLVTIHLAVENIGIYLFKRIP